MPERTDQPPAQPTPTPWPPGVTHRYLTFVGAHVDITDNGPASRWRYDLTCTGCPLAEPLDIDKAVHRAAQEHAETCRALPRPEVK